MHNDLFENGIAKNLVTKQSTEIKAFSVSELNLALANLLATNFSSFWIYGEVINFSDFRGHWYFSLRDKNSQINCVMFSSRNIFQSQKIYDGLFIYIKASANIYTAKGNLQLIVEGIKLQDEGDILRKIKLLKQKLLSEGIFDKPKKAIPVFPKNIALITSAKGAVIHDILQVFEKNWRLLNITNFDTSVQGKNSVNQICRAFNLIDKNYLNYDLVVLARGGGADTELNIFNDEKLIRTIYSAKLPVITAIGHATDTSLADLVADYSATTPTAAAEKILSGFVVYKEKLTNFANFLNSWQSFFLAQKNKELTHIIDKLRFFKSRLVFSNDYLKQKKTIIKINLSNTINTKQNRLHLNKQKLNTNILLNKIALLHDKLFFLNKRLLANNPTKRVLFYQSELYKQLQVMLTLSGQNLSASSTKLAQLAFLLDNLSPLKNLNRGFILAKNNKSQVLKSINNIKCDEKITLQFIDGKAICVVKEKF